jgi:hypothetical protein
MKDKLKEAQELEQKAKEIRYALAEQKRREEIQREDEFEKTMKINAYRASDYAGLVTPEYSFYFGYEETACPVKSHRKNCEDYGCEKREWCFTADKNGKEVMRLRKSELFPNDEGSDMYFYLVMGIGHFLKSLEVKEKGKS